MAKKQDDAILVTGAAGYIGSHVVWALCDAGWPVVAVDDLSTGDRRALPESVELVVGDIADPDVLSRVLAPTPPAAIIHLAGSIVVEESVHNPLKYYRNNACAAGVLIEACLNFGVFRFIFSSTAAVYGEPATVPVSEDAPTSPINPYGASKLVVEWMLRDAAAATDLRYAALRYFNVSGADPSGRIGQRGANATHLLKVACEAAVGSRDRIQIFGTDYDTPDGTCIRDYIHVSDLARAHVAALRYLKDGGESVTLNCGYGDGFSVRQVLAAVEKAAGRRLDIVPGPRRAGDAPVLISDARRILQRLDWRPELADLDTIVRTALAWEQGLAGNAP